MASSADDNDQRADRDREKPTRPAGAWLLPTLALVNFALTWAPLPSRFRSEDLAWDAAGLRAAGVRLGARVGVPGIVRGYVGKGAEEQDGDGLWAVAMRGDLDVAVVAAVTAVLFESGRGPTPSPLTRFVAALFRFGVPEGASAFVFPLVALRMLLRRADAYRDSIHPAHAVAGFATVLGWISRAMVLVAAARLPANRRYRFLAAATRVRRFMFALLSPLVLVGVSVAFERGEEDAAPPPPSPSQQAQAQAQSQAQPATFRTVVPRLVIMATYAWLGTFAFAVHSRGMAAVRASGLLKPERFVSGLVEEAWTPIPRGFVALDLVGMSAAMAAWTALVDAKESRSFWGSAPRMTLGDVLLRTAAALAVGPGTALCVWGLRREYAGLLDCI